MKPRFLKLISVSVGVALFPALSYGKVVIQISSQVDFDALGKNINICLKKGETDIRVFIARGVYYYTDNHVDLIGQNNPMAKVYISGDDVTLIAQGRRYVQGASYQGVFSPNKTFLDEDNQLLKVWSPLFQMQELIEILSVDKKLCRVKNLSSASGVSSVGSYIQVTSWYQSFVYKIDRIEGGYIYFTADNLKNGYRGDWNVNDDFNYGMHYPRYRLCNVDLGGKQFYISKEGVTMPSGIQSVHECEAARFLVLGYGTRIGTLEVTGITFKGNAYNGEWGVFSLLSPQGKVTIRDCIFWGLSSSRAIAVGNKNNVFILNCRFKDCSESCIISSHDAVNTVIRGCEFVRCGTALKNSFCVRCFGENYYIGNNIFEDYGYSAIGLGYGSGNEHKSMISGIVEYNTLRYTDDYMANLAQHTLMDSGAIYVSTQNDDTLIRYNIINQYSGMYENRGVFCDDGARNLKIYGNVIIGVTNFFSIDSRRVSSVETKSGPANVGNVIRDNIVDNQILLAGREETSNGCEYGPNYFLMPVDAEKPAVEIKNVKVTGPDIVFIRRGITDGRIIVSYKDYKAIMNVLGAKQAKGLFRHD